MMSKQTLSGAAPRLARWTACATFLCAMGLGPLDVRAEDPVFSRRSRFRIPFQLDAAEIARLGAVEIRLYVSTDRGQTWGEVQSVPAVEGKFAFKADSDGEYWFAVRTLDRQQQLHPSGPLQPGLRVIVDQTAPALELEVDQREPGRVGIRWEAADDHLDVDSLKLELHEEGAAEWQPIEIVGTPSGKTSWPLPGGGDVTIRARIADRAGNTASTEGSARIAPAASTRTVSGPQFAPTATAAASETTPAASSPPAVPFEGPIITPGDPWAPRQTAKTPQRPPARSEVTAAETPAESGARRVRTRQFEIAYALDHAGPPGASSVELYITENNGRKWYHYGSDPDGRSPLEVSVPRAGAYGFTIRLRHSGGTSQRPPQPGEAPELIVVVDQTSPVASLRSVRARGSESPQEVEIEWALSDESLPAEPVALFWGESRNGPWQPITGWQPNIGHYLWTVSPEVPRHVYVRLEGRDTAGNITQIVSEQPLVLRSSGPRVRVLDVTAAGRGESG